MSPIDYEADTIEVLLRTGTHFVLIGIPRKLWHLPERGHEEMLASLERNKKLPSKEGDTSGYELYANAHPVEARDIRSCESLEGPSSGCLFFLELSLKRVAFISPRAESNLPSDAKTVYIALGTLSHTKDEMSAWQQTVGKEMAILTTSAHDNSNPSPPYIQNPARSFSWRGRIPVSIKYLPEIENAARNLGFIEFKETK